MNNKDVEKLDVAAQEEPYFMMLTNMRDFIELQEKILSRIEFYEGWKLAEWQNRVAEKRADQYRQTRSKDESA